MTTYDWLLMFHMTGAFLLVGGTVAATLLNAIALRARRPSEVALLLGLVRRLVPVIMGGALLALVFGLWLVHSAGRSFGAFWISGSLVLWVLATGLGGYGGKAQGAIRRRADALAADGDEPSNDLHAMLRSPALNAMSWASGLAVLAILALMIWKPGQ